MEYFMAPMEGLTGYIYRNAYHACFMPMDLYFTPFISAKAQGGLSSRELGDILPGHNQGLSVIPQIMTNRSEDFLRVAGMLKEYGYREINLNLGCPSGTVTSKHKGAGFLSMTHALDAFMGTVLEQLDKMEMKLSVKTRLGMCSPNEFYDLLELYNKHTLTRLVIHPRVRLDYYKNTPNQEMFRYGLEHSRNPVCYNGDLFTPGDYDEIQGMYPKLDMVMMGRGMIGNPGLAEEIRTGKQPEKARFVEFHQRVYGGYREIMSGDRNVLFKMKEIWSSMIQIFTDDGTYGKKIKKAQRLSEYEAAVSRVFRDLDIRTKMSGEAILQTHT